MALARMGRAYGRTQAARWAGTLRRPACTSCPISCSARCSASCPCGCATGRGPPQKVAPQAGRDACHRWAADPTAQGSVGRARRGPDARAVRSHRCHRGARDESLHRAFDHQVDAHLECTRHGSCWRGYCRDHHEKPCAVPPLYATARSSLRAGNVDERRRDAPLTSVVLRHARWRFTGGHPRVYHCCV